MQRIAIAIICALVMCSAIRADDLTVTVVTKKKHANHDEIEVIITPDFSGMEDRRIKVKLAVVSMISGFEFTTYVTYDTYDASDDSAMNHTTFLGLDGDDELTPTSREVYRSFYEDDHRYVLQYTIEKKVGGTWVPQKSVDKLIQCE